MSTDITLRNIGGVVRRNRALQQLQQRETEARAKVETVGRVAADAQRELAILAYEEQSYIQLAPLCEPRIQKIGDAATVAMASVILRLAQ